MKLGVPAGGNGSLNHLRHIHFQTPHLCLIHLKRITSMIDSKREHLRILQLGTPLVTLAEVAEWAKSVTGILRRIRDGMEGSTLVQETRQVQNLYGIQDIYEKNTHSYLY